MESIDKITLELLMNKTSYNKYLEKSDPQKSAEQKEFYKKIQKYKSKMLSVTQKYLENPYLQINLEINEMFQIYCKSFIKYFEMEDLERSCCPFYQKQDDEDILFDPTKMNSNSCDEVYVNNENNVKEEQEDENEVEDTASHRADCGSSFWSGERVVKKSYKYKKKISP